ncbi:sugar ABC transporter substrate-binding protein [Cryobacterium tagatosivorans]|uniref:Sugar ABC transporter substrate-binding protein n=2 Tax=Cryobacterium tagatosivorans TaxID=1259199 RepID=A0A4R8UJE2_9MICO|nr:sugar ABC transporter substrate-binding protein [Cryobacterium tagatosivorans]
MEGSTMMKSPFARSGRRARRALALALAVATVASLAACGSSNDSASGGEVELRFLFPEYSAKTTPLMKTVVDDFNAANKGEIKVNLETAPWDKMHDKLAVSMGSDQAPDVFGYATRWISEFAGLKQLAPLDDVLTSDFREGFNQKVLEAGVYEGKTYGLPVAVSARLLFYRTDVLEKAGLSAPKTWDDLMEAATETANPPELYGLGVPASGIEVDTFFNYFLYNNGGDILDSDGKSMLSEPESVEALEFLTDLVKSGGSQPEPSGFTREQVIENFKAGQLAMYPTGPWLTAMIKADNPSLEFDAVPFPTNDGKEQQTVSVTDSLGMSASGAHQAEAWKFIEFMYQPKYRQVFDETEGMLPELNAVAESAYYQTPEYKPFIDALSTAKFQPQHPKFEQIQQIETVAIQKALSGLASPQEALDEATAKIDKL